MNVPLEEWLAVHLVVALFILLIVVVIEFAYWRRR